MARVSALKIGLEVAEKLFGPDYHIGGAEHDVLYLFPDDTELSDEDKKKLEAAGWNCNDEYGWYHFV